MSEFTTTPFLGLYKPDPGKAIDLWGDWWNTNADTLDGAVQTLNDTLGDGPWLPLTGGAVSGATTFGSTLAFGTNQSIGTFTGNLTTPTLTLTGSGPSIGLQINTKGAGIVNIKALNIADPANGQGFSTNNSLQVHNDPNYTGGAGHTAFAVLQNASGSLGAGVWYSNLFNVADNVAVGVSGDGSAAYTHQTNLTLNTGFRGSRFATGASMTISGTSGNLNTDTASYYVASQGQATANVNDNGVPGTPHGNLFGSFFQANLLPGATNWYQVSGEEVDVGIAAGSSAAYLSGHAVVLLYNHAVATPNASHAYAVGRQQGATVGWDIGIAFGGPQGWFPIAPTGSIITAKPTILGGTPPAMACAFGIDLSLVTFSTAFLKSQGFQVDGTGNVTAASLQCGTTAGPTWTTGTAAPTATAPIGSLYSRTGGAVGATLYVSRGAGTWAAVAGV
jgi:hypothetical protein